MIIWNDICDKLMINLSNVLKRWYTVLNIHLQKMSVYISCKNIIEKFGKNHNHKYLHERYMYAFREYITK